MFLSIYFIICSWRDNMFWMPWILSRELISDKTSSKNYLCSGFSTFYWKPRVKSTMRRTQSVSLLISPAYFDFWIRETSVSRPCLTITDFNSSCLTSLLAPINPISPKRLDKLSTRMSSYEVPYINFWLISAIFWKLYSTICYKYCIWSSLIVFEHILNKEEHVYWTIAGF